MTIAASASGVSRFDFAGGGGGACDAALDGRAFDSIDIRSGTDAA